jgi:hypothetical protein
MPLVPYELAIGSRQATLPAQVQPGDVEIESNASALDVAAAAFRQSNTISNAPQLISDAIDSFDDVYDPLYDPLADDEIAGFEEHADRFIGVTSRSESQRIKNRIRTELADRKVIAEAGWGGLAASIAAGLIDPVTLASMAVPLLGTGTRGMRIAKGIAASIALDSTQEAFLHAEQSLRTFGESAINVAAGALVTGALGAIATRVPKTEFNALIDEFKKLDEAIAPGAREAVEGGIESTGGAARVGFGTTLDDETVAPGGQALLKTLGKINPIARVMQSSSKRARILMQEMTNIPFLLNKHLKGVATPRSAEGEILAEQAERYRLVKETDAAWREHKAAGGGLSRARFGEELAYSLRRGDTSMEPEIQRLTASYRRYFDESLKKLKAAGLLPEEAGVQFAMSYLPRLYDHAKIKADRINLENALFDYFSRSGELADKAEVRSAVTSVVETLRGAYRDHAQISPGFVATEGAIKGRTLSVPDEVLEPWLVNDIDRILEHYVRHVTPQLVLTKKFGEMDLRQPMQDVSDEFDAMRERAKTNEAKTRIDEEKDATLKDLQAVRDLLLGKYGRPADPDSLLVKGGRVARAVNYMRLLGGQVLSSVPDLGRIVARHGLARTGAKIAKLVTDSNIRNLSKTEAHRVGTALEYVLNTRADTLGEIGDDWAANGLQRRLRNASNTFSRVTGMASWNSALKTLAVALEQDAIVRAAKGGKLTKFQRGQLANLGIGDRMADRIGRELDRHGEDIDGLFRANAEKWGDKEAASAYEAALLKSADQVVLTKGVGDVPLFMNKEVGKTLLQFKSFGMAAVNRLLIPMAQGVRHGDLATLNGAWVMLALGALANAARDTAAGYKPATDPSRIVIEAIDRAGFTTFLAEPMDLVSGLVGGPRFGRFTSQSLVETAGGPTFGTAQDIYDTARGAFTEKGKFDPEIKAADVYRFRKLLPYQNLFYLRRLINMLEGEFSEAIGAEGAGTKPAVDRLTEMKELNRG